MWPNTTPTPARKNASESRSDTSPQPASDPMMPAFLSRQRPRHRLPRTPCDTSDANRPIGPATTHAQYKRRRRLRTLLVQCQQWIHPRRRSSSLGHVMKSLSSRMKTQIPTTELPGQDLLLWADTIKKPIFRAISYNRNKTYRQAASIAF